MCGIVGAFDIEATANPSLLVDLMSHRIAHRGPDDHGKWLSRDGRVALGSRRLSIIDLSDAGHMPMCNEDGSVWLVFNGEIYNFRSLRDQLLGQGHRFRSQTDTEVLVHLYEEKGDEFLTYLDGMFAIALWDENMSRLIVARDRLGEKPLYYAEFSGVFRFASEMKALFSGRDLPKSVDLRSLNQYLTFGFVQPPGTMFSGVRKLGPGEVLTVDARGHRTLRQYWTPLSSDVERQGWAAKPLSWHVREVRQHLERSVAACLVADVPIGAFLSGGLDSSAVVALMARLKTEPIECITVVYPGQQVIDESPFAERVALHVGAHLHRVEVTEADALDCFARCVYHLDEPISDPASISSYFGSAFLRSRGIPVALVGEGADELFLGYPYYGRHNRLAPVWNHRRFVPRFLRRAAFRAISPLMGHLGIEAHRDMARRAADGEGLFVSSEPFFSDLEKWQLVGGPLTEIARMEPSAGLTDQIIREVGAGMEGDLLAQMGLAEVRMRMAEKLLMRVDKMSMAHSVEIRAPLLDHHLARYALSLPGNVRTTGGEPKALLRMAVADLLPRETIHRSKVGFSTPVAHWFRSSFGDRLESLVASSQLCSGGTLNSRKINRILSEHRSGRRQHHARLWNLLCLLQWLENSGMRDVHAEA